MVAEVFLATFLRSELSELQKQINISTNQSGALVKFLQS